MCIVCSRKQSSEPKNVSERKVKQWSPKQCVTMNSQVHIFFSSNCTFRFGQRNFRRTLTKVRYDRLPSFITRHNSMLTKAVD